MPVAYEAGETSAAARRREAAARRKAEAQRRKEARARAAAMRELHRISRQVERDLPRGTTGADAPRPQRWDQRQAERDAVAGASFGSAVTESATEKKRRRKAAAAERRRRPTLSPSRGFAEGQVARVAGRGKLTGEPGFYEWARESGRFNPSYEQYLEFVANRRDIEKTGGAGRLAARARREATSGLTEGRRLEGQAQVGLARSPDVGARDALSFGSGLRGRALEPRDRGGPLEFFTQTVPEFFSETAPGAVEGFFGDIFNELAPRRGGQAIPAAALGQEQARTAGTIGAVNLASLPVRAVTQIAEGFAYMPAFAYYFTTDPVGTAAGVYDYAKQAVSNPARFLIERPGDSLMLLFGAKGLVSGRLPNVVGAAARGDARGAVRAAVTPARSTGSLTRGVPGVDAKRFIPGAYDRQRVRDQELIARIEAAEPATLDRIANQVVMPKPKRATKRQAVQAQSEAIRAVMEQVTPTERRTFFETARDKTGLGSRALGGRYRLNRLVEANQIVEAGNLVRRVTLDELPPAIRRIAEEKGITSPLWFNDGPLAALGERVILSSVRQETSKLDLNLVEAENAAERIDRPGAMFRDQDQPRGERVHLVADEYPGGREFAPTLETVQLLEARRDSARARLDDLESRRAGFDPNRPVDPAALAAARGELEAAEVALREASGAAPLSIENVRGELTRRGFSDAEISKGMAWAEANRDFLARSPEEFSRYLGSQVARGNAQNRRSVYDPDDKYLSRQHVFGSLITDALSNKRAAGVAAQDAARGRVGTAKRSVFDLEKGIERPMTVAEARSRLTAINRDASMRSLHEDIRDQAAFNLYGAGGAAPEQARLNRAGPRAKARQTSTGSRIDREYTRLLNEFRRAETDDPRFVRLQGLLDEWDQLNRVIERNAPDPLGVNELGPVPTGEMPRITPGATERAELDVSIADQARIIDDLENSIADQQPWLPRPEPLTPGLVYSPYSMESVSPAAVIRSMPQRVRTRLGTVARPNARREFTGSSLTSGRVGNVIRLTAKEELGMLRYQVRLDAWKEARQASITARELLRRVRKGEEDLSDYAAVRMRPGTSAGPTKLMLEWFDQHALNDRGTRLLDVVSKKVLEERKLAVLMARESDFNGQIRFFKPAEIGLQPLEIHRPGGFKTTWRTVNQLAKTSVLTLGLTAYLIPNLIGQEGFSLIHKGVQQPFTDFWSAPRILRQLDAETRTRVRATNRTGIVRSLQPGAGPLPWFRHFNQKAADFYSRILDDFWRDGAFVYEAKARGYRTPEDITRLVHDGTKKGTKEHGDLLDIKHAVDEHFGAFDRLIPFEKNTLSEVIFFYPWLRASAVYTAKLPLNHPVKAAVLEIGGSYSFERARDDYIEMFLGVEGVTLEQAEEAADFIMDRAPGMFLTEDGTAIDPRAISLASSPQEAFRVLSPLLTRGEWDETGRRLLDTGVPALSIASAAAQGAISPPWVELPPAEERVAEASQTLNRDVTLARRLSGDQGSWFDFTTGQAAGSRGLGSWFPKGVNPEAILESAARESDEPKPPELNATQKLYKWALAEGNIKTKYAEVVRTDVRVIQRTDEILNAGLQTLASQLGLMRENAPDTPSTSKLTSRQEYAVRIGVLAMRRPGFLVDDWKEQYRAAWESGDPKAIRRLKTVINDGLYFKDRYGRQLPGLLEELRASVGAGG